MVIYTVYVFIPKRTKSLLTREILVEHQTMTHQNFRPKNYFGHNNQRLLLSSVNNSLSNFTFTFSSAVSSLFTSWWNLSVMTASTSSNYMIFWSCVLDTMFGGTDPALIGLNVGNYPWKSSWKRTDTNSTRLTHLVLTLYKRGGPFSHAQFRFKIILPTCL